MKDQILKTCKLMLTPAVRLLVRSGFGWNEFAEIGKQAFVDVARQDYGLQGRPTNSARVALMTGLSRREVARIKKILIGEKPSIAESRSRISHVLSGWHLDPEFLDQAGKPAALPEKGDKKSLFALVGRYGGDIPRGALIKELTHLGLIVAKRGKFEVTARDYLRAASDPDMLRQGGQALHDHAATVVHNVAADRSGPPRFERMATQVDLDPSEAAAFEEHVAEKGQAFLEEMDQWLLDKKTGSSGRSDRTRSIRTGIGLYLIHDETERTQNNV